MTFLTSDILIYNILKKSDDPFISKCNVKFIDRSIPALEDDTIYIATIDCETNQELFDGTEFKALVNIFVKTKDTDYVNGSRFLRTVIMHIKKVLIDDEDCKLRQIRFRNIKYEYGSNYTLKGLHMLVQLLEQQDYDEDLLNCIDEITIDEIETE